MTTPHTMGRWAAVATSLLVLAALVSVASASAASVTVTSASATLRPGAAGSVVVGVQGVRSCSLRLGSRRRTVALDPGTRTEVVFRYRINRSARPGRYVGVLACGARTKNLPLRVRDGATARRGETSSRARPLLAGLIRVTVTRLAEPSAPGVAADPSQPAGAGTAPTGGATGPATSTTEAAAPANPRVQTWSFEQPFAIPTTGPVALVHFWGGCPTCNSEPGYEQLQAWADAHPDVTVIAFSCMRDLHTEWLQTHPSWRRQPGFPIYLPRGDVGAFDTCIERIGHGLRAVYHTSSTLADGVARPFAAPWFLDFPLRRR